MKAEESNEFVFYFLPNLQADFTDRVTTNVFMVSAPVGWLWKPNSAFSQWLGATKGTDSTSVLGGKEFTIEMNGGKLHSKPWKFWKKKILKIMCSTIL